MLTTNTWLKVICSMQINAILFGVGAVTVLSIPELAAQAKYLIPAVVLASFILAPIAASFIAPRLRLRMWGKQAWRRGDWISG